MTETCKWCGGSVDDGTTCPWSVACPSCRQPPGSPCRRPSGHNAMDMHMTRVRVAEAKDAER